MKQLSGLDASFLYLETAEMPMHVGALHQFEHVLKAHAGTTPVLIEATTASGVGRLSINGGRGLRMDAALPGLLRSLPGVQAVNVHLGKPWAQ